MCIYPIKYSIILRKGIRSEWKGCRESLGRNIPKYIDLISCKWACCYKSLLGSKKSLFCENIASSKHHIELVRYFLHFLFAFSVCCNIESEVKIFLLSTCQCLLKLIHILYLSIKMWISNKSLVTIDCEL